MRVAVALLCTLCFASDALADPQVWLNPGIYSLHVDRGKDLRDDNIGVGIELVMAPEHAVSAGTFHQQQSGALALRRARGARCTGS